MILIIDIIDNKIISIIIKDFIICECVMLITTLKNDNENNSASHMRKSQYTRCENPWSTYWPATRAESPLSAARKKNPTGVSI